MLHTGSIDGYCLVSGDSDFTRLATHIREASPSQQQPVAELPKLKPILLNALSATARKDGWTTLAALGGQINRGPATLRLTRATTAWPNWAN